MFETLKTLYEDDEISIEDSNIVGTCFYYNYFDKNVRVDIDTKLTQDQAKQLAPILKQISNRLLSYGQTSGFEIGLQKGESNIKNGIKKLLGIMED